MRSSVGTISIGVRAPIIKEGDDLAEIVARSIVSASTEFDMPIEEKDVIAVTESVVARSQGNYVTVDDIAREVHEKFGNSKVGVLFPILSRNRFAMIFKGICRGAKGGVVLQLSLPADEVGNHLISDEEWFSKVDGNFSLITEAQYRELFGYPKHEFTGIDYVEYYKSIAKEEGCSITVVFANNPSNILYFAGHVLCCDIHSRFVSKNVIRKRKECISVYSLDELCTKSVNGSGYNAQYGLLGSNKSNEERLKLFPRDAGEIAQKIKSKIKELTGVEVEVMIYGDGAFKDPVGKIWELADPVVSPGYTPGVLSGRPNELKLKALADGKYADLTGDVLNEAITHEIRHKGGDLVGSMESQGTTPRQYTDLLGSLADLTSGSGDKGTPIVWIKNYFRNYAD